MWCHQCQCVSLLCVVVAVSSEESSSDVSVRQTSNVTRFSQAGVCHLQEQVYFHLLVGGVIRQCLAAVLSQGNDTCVHSPKHSFMQGPVHPSFGWVKPVTSWLLKDYWKPTYSRLCMSRHLSVYLISISFLSIIIFYMFYINFTNVILIILSSIYHLF